MMPVARTSFCIQAYHAAHNLSATFRLALYLLISSYWPQYVTEGNTVEFLQTLDARSERGKGLQTFCFPVGEGGRRWKAEIVDRLREQTIGKDREVVD